MSNDTIKIYWPIEGDTISAVFVEEVIKVSTAEDRIKVHTEEETIKVNV
jgi:hypothetical protein